MTIARLQQYHIERGGDGVRVNELNEGRQGDVQTEGIGRQPRDSLSRGVVMVECGAGGGGGCAL